MRFGRALHEHRISEWTSSYLDYYSLKKCIKLAIRDAFEQSNHVHLAIFSTTLDAELAKVEAFYLRQHTNLQKQRDSLLRRYTDDASGTTISGHDLDLRERVAALVACIQYSLGLRKLRWYGKVNSDGLRYIFRKIERIPEGVRLQKRDVSKLEFFHQLETLRELEAVDASIRNLTSAFPSTDQPPSRPSKLNAELPVNADFNNVSEALLHDNVDKLEEFLNLSKWHDNFTQSVLQQALVTQSSSCASMILLHLDTKMQDEGSDTLRNSLHHVVILALQRAVLCHTDSNKERYTDLAVQYDSCSSDTLPMLIFILETLSKKQRHAITQRDDRGRTPLHYAAEAGLTGHCDILIEFMARWNILRGSAPQGAQDSIFIDTDEATPFHLCVTNGHEGTIRSLLSFSELLEYCWGPETKIGDALAGLLHIALSNKAIGIVQVLLDTQLVNLSYRGPRNETAIFIASRERSYEHIDLLTQATSSPLPDLNIAESSYGWTPLIVACVQEKLDVVKLLLEMGVHQAQTDVFGWTALDHVAFRGYWEISKLLEPSCRGPSLRLPKVPLPVTNALPPCSPSITRVFVNLGPLNTRKPHVPVDLSPCLLQNPYNPYPEVGFSVVIDGLGMDGPGGILTLPVLDDTVNHPLVFQTEDPKKAKFVLKVFCQISKAPGHPTHIRTAVALLDELSNALGPGRESFFRDHILPIIGCETFDLIGTLTVNFLLATPFPDPRTSPKPALKKDTWNSNGTTRLIGHRGLGMNSPAFKRLQIGENTIQSFKSTINLGVSYVECDVQLTRDHVPVIYHDFMMSESGADIAPHNLSFDQFMCISDMQRPASNSKGPSDNKGFGAHVSYSPTSLRHRSLSFDAADSCQSRDFLTRIQQTYEFKLKGFKGNIRGAHIHDSFTTLEELLRTLPEEVAIDIELKYPMLWEAEDWKMDLYGVEFNLYTDTILDQIYKYAGNRSILFTSFSPELCIIVAHKQDTYPVMFLNESNLFPTGDVRASNLQEAIHFARHWGLPGVVMSAEPFVASPKLIKYVQDAGLICFSFGAPNNDTENATVQVEAGLDALIVDSVALINDSFKKRVGVTSARLDNGTMPGASGNTL